MPRSRNSRRALIVASTFVLAASALRAAEGDPAGSSVLAFDEGGSTALNGDSSAATVVYPDGRIFQFGTVVTGAGTFSMAAAQFLPNGFADPDFGTNGRAVNPFGLANNSWGVAAHRLPSGLILVGGTVDIGSGNHNFFMGILEPNGIPYELFGDSGEGYTTETFPGGDSTDDLAAITADRFGNIVAVGTVDIGPGDTDIGVARLTPTGAWDDSFSGDGNTTVAFGSGPDRGLALAIGDDDRIVVGGAAWTTGTGSDYDWAVAVLDSSGSPVNAFDGNGLWIASGDAGGTNNDFIRDLEVWPDGEIVAAGDREVDADRSQWAVLSIAPTGGVPAVQSGAFCGDSEEPCPNGPQDSARALVLQGDEKIVIGGFGRGTGGTVDFGAARLHRNLALDGSFAADGATTFDFDWGAGADADEGSAVALDLDGRIVVGGTVEWSAPDTDFGWARLDSNYIFADGFEWAGGTSRWSATAD